MIDTILLFILSLLVVVVVHEFGHFITSKRAGVVVEEFGIGFPPRLFGRVWRGTMYSLNALPVGAFVRSRSEDDPTAEGSLASKGPWPRFAVYAAGPVFNVVLAFLLFTAFFGLPRTMVVSDGVLVYQVQSSSAAEAAGLRSGDVIVEADGNSLATWDDLQSELSDVSQGEAVQLLVLREGSERMPVSVSPRFDEDLGRNVIGITLGRNLVADVTPGSLAQQAGIATGDSLLAVDGKGVINEASLSNALQEATPGSTVVLTLLRDSQSRTVEFSQRPADFQTLGLRLLWAPNTRIEKRPTRITTAAISSARFMIAMPALIVASIPLMQEDPSLAFVGPIGAGQLTVEAVQAFGVSNLLYIGGLISLGIAMFNLFPVPPLDGGGMLVALTEAVRRGRRLSTRAIRLAYSVGTALLITLMVFITTSDILRVVEGRGFGL
jgi:regulator of sigma E protease